MKYWPEAICLLVLFAASLLYVDVNNSIESLDHRLELKKRLHTSIIQHTIETVTIDYGDSNHYDKHAQDTLRIDQLLEQFKSTERQLVGVIQKYQSETSKYIQLVTILNSSEKLIASLSSKLDAAPKALKELINRLAAKISEFTVTRSAKTKQQIVEIIESNNQGFKQVENYGVQWEMLRLHINYILENAELTYQQINAIKNSKTAAFVNDSISQTTETLNQQRKLQIILGIVALSCLFGLFVLALRRQSVKLQLALQEAQNASQVKSDFLASMSHEIRTPMNGILGMLNLVTKESLSTKQKHYAKMAQSSADSLLVIINDILDVSKIEAGKIELESIDFNIQELFHEFSNLMAPRVHELGLEFILDIGGLKKRMVKGDPGRIKQILTNLVGNSIKFTEQGEIILRASITEDEDSDDALHLDISVIDSGIGISSANLEHLFEVFTQADSSTTRKFGGTGLGLSIVKQLSQLMGGDVQVTSQLNKGSQFNVSIVVETSDMKLQAIPSIDMSGIEVLIVDDNETNIEVLAGLLEEKQLKVTSCKSAADCLWLLEQNLSEQSELRYKVAILDMQMPHMDGVALAKQIRKNSQYDTMSLVMMTSMGDFGKTESYKTIGFSAYFNKPVIAQDLYDALSLIISNDCTKDTDNLLTHHALSAMRATYTSDHNLAIDGSQHQILLVDDSEINQAVAQGMLEEFGFKVDVAFDGVQAIERLSESSNNEEYSLVFMDCQMPVLDGYSATRKIREGAAGERYKDVIIVAMTANAMQGDKEKCLDAGMNDYLSKPLDEKPMVSCLTKWLDLQMILPNDSDSSGGEIADTTEQGTEEQSSMPLWDQQAFMKRMNNRHELAAKIVHVFLTDIPEKLTSIENHISNNDTEQTKSDAHTLKGIFANISALKLQQVSERIEILAKKQDNKGLQEELQNLKLYFSQLKLELQSKF